MADPDPSRRTAVIAVDGPSGSGKSSVSRGVARRLDLKYLDTGAMYRAMTWWMLREQVDVDDATAVAARSQEPDIRPGCDPDRPTITVDGVDVSGPIRGSEVTAAVSAVSAVPAVRSRLVRLQKDAIGKGGIVVEGRDIGTVVAPEAVLKVFLTAAPEARARRRNAELVDPATVDATLADLHRRDDLDSTRTTSPLQAASDAVEVDATDLTLEEVVEVVVALVEERLAVV